MERGDRTVWGQRRHQQGLRWGVRLPHRRFSAVAELTFVQLCLAGPNRDLELWCGREKLPNASRRQPNFWNERPRQGRRRTVSLPSNPQLWWQPGHRSAAVALRRASGGADLWLH